MCIRDRSAIDYVVYRAIPAGDFRDEALCSAITAFLAAERVDLERSSPKGSKIVNIRPAVEKLYCEGGYVYCELWLNRGAAVKLTELIPLLVPGATALHTERIAMYITKNGSHCEP